jgi:eukaryotic-like serine/threonine-protein kinase
LLAKSDNKNPEWQQAGSALVMALANSDEELLSDWIEFLKPVSSTMVDPLSQMFLDSTRRSGERKVAAAALGEYATSSQMAELLLQADAPRYVNLFQTGPRNSADMAAMMRQEFAEPENGSVDSAATAASIQRRDARRRNAIITLMRLEQAEDVDQFLKISSDPTARTMAFLEAPEFGVSPELRLRLLKVCRNASARQALLLTFRTEEFAEMSTQVQDELYQFCRTQFEAGQHQQDRSAAEWLLRNRKPQSTNPSDSLELDSTSIRDRDFVKRDWWMTSRGQTMVKISAPGKFQIGSPESEPERDIDEQIKDIDINYSFAVSAHEITAMQMQEFRGDGASSSAAIASGLPINGVNYDEALKYCRWLSEKEDISEDEMCYPEFSEITAISVLPDDKLRRTGYRLLTEPEWEYVCRAGSRTAWYFGSREEHLRYFAWYSLTSTKKEIRPVGLMRPNGFGLFDITGNIAEWCHSEQFGMRGASFTDPGLELRSARRYHQSPKGYSFIGFRICRTMRDEE